MCVDKFHRIVCTCRVIFFLEFATVLNAYQHVIIVLYSHASQYTSRARPDEDERRPSGPPIRKTCKSKFITEDTTNTKAQHTVID